MQMLSREAPPCSLSLLSLCLFSSLCLDPPLSQSLSVSVSLPLISVSVCLCFFPAAVCWSQLPSAGPGELILQIFFQPSVQQVTSVT